MCLGSPSMRSICFGSRAIKKYQVVVAATLGPQGHGSFSPAFFMGLFQWVFSQQFKAIAVMKTYGIGFTTVVIQSVFSYALLLSTDLVKKLRKSSFYWTLCRGESPTSILSHFLVGVCAPREVNFRQSSS